MNIKRIKVRVDNDNRSFEEIINEMGIKQYWPDKYGHKFYYPGKQYAREGVYDPCNYNVNEFGEVEVILFCLGYEARENSVDSGYRRLGLLRADAYLLAKINEKDRNLCRTNPNMIYWEDSNNNHAGLAFVINDDDEPQVSHWICPYDDRHDAEDWFAGYYPSKK